MRIVVVGDARIGSEVLVEACKLLSAFHPEVRAMNWLGDDKLDLQRQRLQVERRGPASVPTPRGLVEAVSDCELLLVHYCPVSKEVIDAAPHLRIVGTCRVGWENVDAERATERGIAVFHILGRNAEAVSDFAIGLMLAECRNIARSHLSLMEGTWRKDFPNSAHVPELAGKTVGLVGFGHIGQLVAKKLAGFGVTLLVYDPFVPEAIVAAAGGSAVPLDALMAASDFVSLHGRLTPQSAGMIGEEQIALMKPTAYLINTARAALLDEEALVRALEARRIAGAALDVFGTEPLPPESPLRRLDNVTLTSHLAGTTRETAERSPRMLVEGIREFLAGGEPVSIVNPEALAGHHHRGA